MVKRLFIVLFLVTFLFGTMNLISAFTIISVTPSYVNRTANTLVNITINNTDNFNIAQLTFTLPAESIFYGQNATSASNTFFYNSTQGPFKILVYANTTASGIIPVNETRSFWFNLSIRNLQSSFFTNISISATHAPSGANTQNGYNYPVYFEFAGFVKNETGGNESNVNLTIYRVIEGHNEPSTEIIDTSILSNSNGYFIFPSVNGSASVYKLKMIRYGPASGCKSSNATCNATKIGSILPNFPAMMYYPTTIDMPQFDFMRPPSLNGTTFYLNPAATLRLYAHNISDVQKFGYEVVDQVVGFPTESNVMTSVSTADIVVPTGRNYTVMFARSPMGSSFNFYNSCNGQSMNDTACPTPPISNSTLGTLTQGNIYTVNQSLITAMYRLYGCINTGGFNNSLVNITSLSLKMVPWTGFVPPMRGDMGNLNLATDISYNFSRYTQCGANANDVAFFNITVMGASSGINYMLEIYAKNGTNEASNPGLANNLAGFLNLTITNANKNINFTMYKLAGGYQSSSSLNTTLIKINILNSTGGAITNNMNANVKIKNPVFGTMNYIIESMSSGSFYIQVLNNSNWAKVMIFASDSPPKEVTINLSKSETNITLVTMTDGKGIGMKKINSTGGMEMINSTQLNSTLAMTLSFLRNTGIWGSGCNILEPDSSCILSSMQGKDFNPLTAMVAGKVNMQMKITATNVTMTFVNFDMFAAKQPPMDSIMNDQASGTSTNQKWNFGSFAPANTYEYVIIAMPYTDAAINDSSTITLSASQFQDENWNTIWNSSRGDDDKNLTDDFIDYNSTLYRNYLSSGITCSKTDTDLNVTACYVNVSSNMIYMKIPHFSGVSPTVSGSAPGSGTTADSSTGGGSAITTTWKLTYTINQEQFTQGYTKDIAASERIKFTIDLKDHEVGLTSLTATSATITVSSTPQTATLNIGDTKKFDLNADNFYDVSVKLNSIANNKANLTVMSVHEEMPKTPETTPETTPEINDETNPIFSKSSVWVWVIVVIIIIVAIIVGILIYKRKRYYNKGY